MMQQQQQQQQPSAITEVVDKSLIERLILEHSDRLELEINHKARADAWKFYFRVRIDNMVRPFAVCKVCYRVLHCDSRSGTASLLRHPCNPLSERSPVNRAVRLNAKLKLPADSALKKESNVDSIKRENADRPDANSPGGCQSPTSTVSSPVQTSTRKRKAGPPPAAFPIDLQMFPLSQLMAAAGAHNPLAALYLVNAMNQDPQHFQNLQQQIQQIHLDNLLREQLKNQQQVKDQRIEPQQTTPDQQQLHQDDSKRWCGSPVEPSSSSSISPLHSEENETTNEDPGGGGGGELAKEVVQHLVTINSPRVSLMEKNPPSSNGVWPRFFMVYIDGVPQSYASCKTCRKVVTYSRYTGTGGLLRHRCPPAVFPHLNLTPPHDTSPPPLVRCDVSDDNIDTFKSNQRHTRVSPVRVIPAQVPSSSTPAVAGVARALLRYMCQDLVPGSSIDSPGFQQLVTTLISLGAEQQSSKSGGIDSVPTSQLLLEEHLHPLAALSRDKSARLLQDQPHLCLSCHRPKAELLAVAAHFITQDFQLKSHALGTRRVSEGDTTEDALTALLSECLQESPSLLRERRLTVVSDDGLSNIGTPVTCLWHATEKTLAELNKLPAYVRVSEDTTALLEFLANSGVPGAVQAPRDTPRWEALLHALTFVAANYDKVVEVVRASAGMAPDLGDKSGYQELTSLLGSVRKCLTSIRAAERPTLNHAVLCRTKLLHLCTAPANTTACKLLQEQLLPLFQEAFTLTPLHLVASFLDPRFKMLKVLNSNEKMEVHRLVLEMMKAVSVTDANTGVLNLKTTRRSPSPRPPSGGGHSPATNGGGHVRFSPPAPMEESAQSPDSNPFREYMDTVGASDMSVSDSEEIMAYVNMKVHLDDDDILGWWCGPSSNGLPSLRKLARRVLAIPATCNLAHDIGQRALAATASLPSCHHHRLNDILHVTYNLE